MPHNGARARVNSRGLVLWVLIVLDLVSECASLKPSGKIKATQAAPFPCSLSCNGGNTRIHYKMKTQFTEKLQ